MDLVVDVLMGRVQQRVKQQLMRHGDDDDDLLPMMQLAGDGGGGGGGDEGRGLSLLQPTQQQLKQTSKPQLI